MTPADQRYLAERPDGHTRDGVPGDCYAACWASLLDVPLDDVPHFALFGHGWEDVLRRWLRAGGLDSMWRAPVGGKVELEGTLNLQGIATGPSPRGRWTHCVVVDLLTLETLHDPHPSRAGLAGPPVFVDLIVAPYDPPPAEPIALGSSWHRCHADGVGPCRAGCCPLDLGGRVRPCRSCHPGVKGSP